jgi:hypothetical protein
LLTFSISVDVRNVLQKNCLLNASIFAESAQSNPRTFVRWLEGCNYINRVSGKMPMSCEMSYVYNGCALAAFWRRRAQSRIPGNRVRNSGAAPSLCALCHPRRAHNGGHYNIIHKIVRLCSSFALRAAGAGERREAAPPGALMVRRRAHLPSAFPPTLVRPLYANKIHAALLRAAFPPSKTRFLICPFHSAPAVRRRRSSKIDPAAQSKTAWLEWVGAAAATMLPSILVFITFSQQKGAHLIFLIQNLYYRILETIETSHEILIMLEAHQRRLWVLMGVKSSLSFYDVS